MNAVKDGGILYLDSSALLKLIVVERESERLLSFISGWRQHAVSALAITEVSRAVGRRVLDDMDGVRSRVEAVFRNVALIGVDEELLEAAGALGHPLLRSLDAIHLASALYLGDDLAGLVTYDNRLAEGAVAAAVTVHRPS
ncbi:MAG: type II toxin-antitoxin system VapC family toxin [Actinobacteria bacterium]|nr:type II toxin-antitoxin system VapC family toxin [Actinomycetota bacterium]